MARGIMTNTPFLFSALWLFVKMFLDAKTIAKIGMFSSNYMAQLLEEVPIESIPELLGGKYKGDNEAIKLETGVGGMYYKPSQYSEAADSMTMTETDELLSHGHKNVAVNNDDNKNNTSTHNSSLSSITNSHINGIDNSYHSRGKSTIVYNDHNDKSPNANILSITSSTIATRTTTGSSSNFNSEENPGSTSTTWSQIIFQFLRCEGFALLGIIIFSILFIHFDSDIPKLLVLPFLLYFMVEVLVW